MKRFLVIAMAVAAALLDVVLAYAFDGWTTLRTGGAIAGFAIGGGVLVTPTRVLGFMPIRLGVALATAVVATLAMLDLAVTAGDVFACGFLLGVGGCFALATGCFHALGASDSRLSRFVGGGLLSLATLGLLVSAVECVAVHIAPLSLYDLVPDDRSFGESFTLGPDDEFLGRAEFRGSFRHPEFFGLRVELNGWGLRDHADEATDVAAADDSVLVLGDSFAFGTGVELDETFQERLESSGAVATNRKLRVTNAAMPGNGQTRELQSLDRWAPRVLPDVVVVAFYAGNDFTDNIGTAFRKAREDGVLKDFVAPPKGPPRSERLPRLLEGVLHTPFWIGGSAVCAQLLPTAEGWLVRKGILDRPWLPVNRSIEMSLSLDESVERAYLREDTLKAFDRLRDRCIELDAVMIALMIPAAVTASEAVYATWLAQQPPERRARCDRRAFYDDFVARLAARKVIVVDTLPAIETEEATGRRCYHREGHWNANGHRIAAEVLAPAVRAALTSRDKKPTDR